MKYLLLSLAIILSASCNTTTATTATKDTTNNIAKLDSLTQKNIELRAILEQKKIELVTAAFVAGWNQGYNIAQTQLSFETALKIRTSDSLKFAQLVDKIYNP